MKNIHLLIKEIQQTPRRTNIKRRIFQHNIIKLLVNKDKEKILKAAREK